MCPPIRTPCSRSFGTTAGVVRAMVRGVVGRGTARRETRTGARHRAIRVCFRAHSSTSGMMTASRCVTSEARTAVARVDKFRARARGAGDAASRGGARRGVIRAAGEDSTRVNEVATTFPFVKIVAQEELKLALTLNVVDARIGGVLIMGDRGTAKSVSVRSLVQLLPEIDVVENDAFNSSPTDPELMGPDVRAKFNRKEALKTTKMRVPMVEVPLGTTEDRICGTIDIEKALSEGTKAYDPGLLAKANRGLLYIDEVNLLDDSLVDVVLDSAAGGWNTVEREGISLTHPAKFIMIGSGNPEEGELRPQLLDRFGMAVNIRTIYDLDQRTELVMNKLAYEKDPKGYTKECEAETNELKAKIVAAQKILPNVSLDRDLALKISGVCALVNVDGLRGDIVVTRAAKALVAFEGRDVVTADDIGRIIGPCLSHRLRKDAMDTMDGSFKVMLAFNKIFKGSAMLNFAETMAEGIKAPEPEKPKDEKPKEKPKAKAGAWSGLPGGR